MVPTQICASGVELFQGIQHLAIVPLELIQVDAVRHIVDARIDQNDVWAGILRGQAADPPGQAGGIVVSDN